MLTITLTYGLLALAGLLAIPVIVLAAQVFSACSRNSTATTPLSEARPVLAVLVPAHNEAATIGAACESLRMQLTSGDRLLVGLVDQVSNPPALVVVSHQPQERSHGAVDLALDFWGRITLPNLEQNILPTRPRATLVLRKAADHPVESVLLRKI